jgi:N-dimethylarginine dimethylaminohydrolase
MTLINSTVIMSNADYFSNDQPINPYYADELIDIEKAREEHAEIRRALEAASINIIQVDAPNDSQDGVYTANWALIKDKKAVLARLPDVRKSEENWAEKVIQDQGIEVIHVPDNLRFSGQGDALPCGNYLFCGSKYRSDTEAQAFAAEMLGFTRIQLLTTPQKNEYGSTIINQSSGWPDSFYYDIDLALAIIKGPSEDSLGTIAYCPEAFTLESQQLLASLEGFDKIIVSETEARKSFACNLVSTSQSVIMSAYAPELQSDLEARGLQIFTPEISELAKGGGYIRCTTLSIG